ncbi:MAG: hypothetical protein AAB581_01270 [Patescibacteria group bacterium]
MKLHPVIGLVGKSKAGKSTLMKEVLRAVPGLQVIKSITTRGWRENEEDDLFYHFTSREAFEHKIAQGDFTVWMEHAGNYYGYDRTIVRDILAQSLGICAITEDKALEFAQEFLLKAIKIVPEGGNEMREAFYATHPGRKEADEKREKVHIPLAGYLVNSFAPGGKEEATAALVLLIEKIAETKKG